LVISVYKVITTNPYKDLGKQLLKEDFDVTSEDALSMMGVTIEYLSELFNVDQPKYQVGKLNKMDGQSPMAVYSFSQKTIFVDFDFLLSTNTNFYEFFNTICHEFQHYLDHISIGDTNEWGKEYDANKAYYELRANNFAKKETYNVLKHFVKVCKENEQT